MQTIRSTALASATLATILAGLGVRHATADTVFPAVGASGDRGGELRCPGGQFVVGIKGRFGDWIDQIQIVCGPVRPWPMAQDIFFQADAPAYTSPAFGGPGGAPTEGYCPLGGFLVEVSRMLTQDRRMLQRLDLTCTDPKIGNAFHPVGGMSFNRALTEVIPGRPPLTWSNPSWFGPLGNGVQIDKANLSCRSEFRQPGPHDLGNRKQVFYEAVTGFTVRYGKHVNALGVICGNLPIEPRPSNAIYMSGSSVQGVNLPGADYQSIPLNIGAAARDCQNICAGQFRCKAWTWVRPGVQGPQAMCWLKGSTPRVVFDPATVSGVK